MAAPFDKKFGKPGFRRAFDKDGFSMFGRMLGVCCWLELSSWWGWAIAWRLASDVDTTWPLFSARFTIWSFELTWFTGIVRMVCVAMPAWKRNNFSNTKK